jgi:hypothetical protein
VHVQEQKENKKVFEKSFRKKRNRIQGCYREFLWKEDLQNRQDAFDLFDQVDDILNLGRRVDVEFIGCGVV